MFLFNCIGILLSSFITIHDLSCYSYSRFYNFTEFLLFLQVTDQQHIIEKQRRSKESVGTGISLKFHDLIFDCSNYLNFSVSTYSFKYSYIYIIIFSVYADYFIFLFNFSIRFIHSLEHVRETSVENAPKLWVAELECFTRLVLFLLPLYSPVSYNNKIVGN